MPKKYQKTVRIATNARAGAGHFCLSFRDRDIASSARPGQFLMVRVSDTGMPLLRRPFGIHRVLASGSVEILYERVGKGTAILSARKPGEFVDIIAPLGNGFDLSAAKATRPVLAAGGMGVAPLLFLAQAIRAAKKDFAGAPLVFIGGRSREHIIRDAEFKKLGGDVSISTDDGSRGSKGFVTQPLARALKPGMTVFACGPKPMLKETARVCAAAGATCQVSLEEHMSCGFGACLGCVVETNQGLKRVCQEGPVFDANDITW